MGKKQTVQESPAERELAEVGAQQMADWQQRWAPVLRDFSAGIERAAAPDSRERRRAQSLSAIDTAARFGQLQDAALKVASRTGTVGSAKQKLAVTGIGQDQATSNTFGAVAADQAVDDATTQGLGAVAALGRGQKATATDALARNAQMGARQAAQDAELSLANRAGNARLAATVAGTGLGLWMGAKQPGIPATNDIPGVTGANAMDKFLQYGTSGD